MQFTRFSELPKELRHTIWQYAIPTLTTIVHIETQDITSEAFKWDVICPIDVTYHTERCDAAVACQEALEVFKLMQRRRKPTVFKPWRGKQWIIDDKPIRISPNYDTAYFVVEPERLAPLFIELLGGAYPGLSSTTTTTTAAMAFRCKTSFDSKLESIFRTFGPRRVTIVLAAAKKEISEMKADLASAIDQSEGKCEDWLERNVDPDCPKRRRYTPIYLMVVDEDDHEVPNFSLASYLGLYAYIDLKGFGELEILDT